MNDKGVENPISHPKDRVASQKIDKWLNSSRTRREFTSGTGDALRKIAVAGVILEELRFGFIRKAWDSVVNRAKGTDEYWGQTVEGSEPETLITVPVEGGPSGVPVRSRPVQDEKDLIGLAKFGSEIENAQQVYGGVYASYPEERGRFEKDGKFFGSWYKITIPVKDKEGNEKVVNGYIASNYLREPTKAELSNSR